MRQVIPCQPEKKSSNSKNFVLWNGPFKTYILEGFLSFLRWMPNYYQLCSLDNSSLLDVSI